MKTILETNRLILRELSFDDRRDLAEVLSDPESMKFYPAPFDAERVVRWIQWCNDSYRRYGCGLWAVVLKQSGECIGDCGISLQLIEDERLPEIGYHIKTRHCCCGYATEAALASMNFGFSVLGFDRLISYMNPKNTSSRRVAEKNGMTFVREFEKDGIPQVLYMAERSNWTYRGGL